jgi:hypothetical protein
LKEIALLKQSIDRDWDERTRKELEVASYLRQTNLGRLSHSEIVMGEAAGEWARIQMPHSCDLRAHSSSKKENDDQNQ